eukprot:UN26944
MYLWNVILFEQQAAGLDHHYPRYKEYESGLITKKNVEIVLARYDEDYSWNRVYDSITTVYNKGPELGVDNET